MTILPHITSIITFLLIGQITFAQLQDQNINTSIARVDYTPSNQEIEKIQAAFDYVEYNPDSTIKKAYHLKNDKYHGYAIEFDSIGNPKWIGKYRNGNKTGKWYWSSGGFQIYKKGEDPKTMALAGCGTGAKQMQSDFKALYKKLISK